jgi:hypothetical protein
MTIAAIKKWCGEIPWREPCMPHTGSTALTVGSASSPLGHRSLSSRSGRPRV